MKSQTFTLTITKNNKDKENTREQLFQMLDEETNAGNFSDYYLEEVIAKKDK